MTRSVTPLPWISALLALALVANPVGWDFLHSAFLSGDQLGQNIARPLVLMAIGVVLVLALAEYLLRRWLRARRT
ncbi:MAG: hypothetical protein U1E16_12665 [Hyphomicrobiales bacterium]|uniref:hypothetical protein n=1 Tax=Aestuariivirga sp. TaxID=2650926 RepID=UPI0035B0A3A0